MSDFFTCPVCDRYPKITTYPPNIARASCKGYAFHHHKKISVTVYDQPSSLYKTLCHHWNIIQFREARFLYDDEAEIERLLSKEDPTVIPASKEKEG